MSAVMLMELWKFLKLQRKERNFIMKKTDQVLSYLEDEQSRFIYQKRVEYNETGDYNAIRSIVERYLPGIRVYYPGIEKEILAQVKNKKRIVLFGCGRNGHIALNCLKESGVTVECVIDNNTEKWGTEIGGVMVKAPQDIDYGGVDALIVTPSEDELVDAIHEQLMILGAEPKSFVDFKEWRPFVLLKKQYFEPDIIKLQENEVFVDAGVLDLGTSLRFVKKCEKEHIHNFKIHAFEPDAISYQRCLEIKKKLTNIDLHLHHAGLWSEKKTLQFAEKGSGDSKITQKETGIFINAVPLDQCVSDQVTFIKMDIEGAELEALRGSQKIIQNYSPKLAISIYHKKEDIVNIPLYIKELVPEYKLYIRHYSNRAAETVLYAV